ncbi:hypothetical protein TRAPUB_13501 [Trametes pubescens]|uniref:Magnesium transporter NIPA2 n=1 Tax=Trametes pubescens TaxID=154538 RepID=A0A1M2VR87_TRAPU|nr:hypothetical protein TRAPUB_13501 [Trametes pubescens]
MSSSSDSSQPAQYRAVGVVLAIGSGLLIGSSFVFKKKGLLNAQKGHVAGEGVGYLKSPMWWTGMIIMILGELCNFGAYAFVEAIIVTPMGALSVVISSILSHFLLKEKLSLFGWISSVQCLLGASILALNGPEEQSVSTIEGFKHLFLAPWFLAYGSVVLVAAAVLAFWAAPKWGKQSMLPYIGVCSLIGGLSVSCTQGLGASIVTSIRGDNQFKNWFIYFLLVFVIITLLTEIYYLNIALAMFNTAMVTPTYYVTFTFCTLVTSVILYQGLKASASQIITVVLAFAVICTGIVILQMTKVDPRTLTNVDERTTLLLEAARQEVDPIAAQAVDLAPSGTLRSRRSRQRSRHIRSHTSTVEAGTDADFAAARSTDDLEAGLHPDEESDLDQDFADEKRAIVARTEEPGIDSLRMTGGALGTIIRARRRATALSAASATRSRASQLSSVAETGSMHSARASTRRASPRGESRSPPPGTRPSWFGAFLARRAATADSDVHDAHHVPTPDGVEMSEKAQVAVSTAEVSGLPPITSESPLSSLTDSAQQARFLSDAELVSSPLVTPSSSEAPPRLSTVRFQPDMRSAASVPDVRPHAPGLPQARPSLTVGGDDAAARARTLPLTFTPADRVRADDALRDTPPAP